MEVTSAAHTPPPSKGHGSGSRWSPKIDMDKTWHKQNREKRHIDVPIDWGCDRRSHTPITDRLMGLSFVVSGGLKQFRQTSADRLRYPTVEGLTLQNVVFASIFASILIFISSLLVYTHRRLLCMNILTDINLIPAAAPSQKNCLTARANARTQYRRSSTFLNQHVIRRAVQ